MSLNSAVLPGIGVALLPKLACPACWPAYAGLLSSMGISFVDYTSYLLPLTAVFLFIAIASLTYNAKKRHEFKPLLPGTAASVIILIGKFNYDKDSVMYAGVILLILASLWNTWLKSKLSDSSCSQCIT